MQAHLCGGSFYNDFPHYDRLLLEVDVADGQALVEQLEGSAGARRPLGLLLFAHALPHRMRPQTVRGHSSPVLPPKGD